MVNRKSLFLFAAIVLLLDQISKYLTLSFVGIGNQLEIFTWFSLNVSSNEGIVFGLFKGINTAFIFITILILGLILYYYDKVPERIVYILPIGLVLGGGLGNLADRIFRGSVVDFFDFKIWPIFNLADAAITIGVLFLIFLLWKEEK
ncbi:MAG TPA: signal peptidase II [Candidatus Nanoarchaeia archaeon]|nr:signal peptidase II [Candidatus Nanoarchaeia archaeon]